MKRSASEPGLTLFIWGATTAKAFIEDLASSGFCENKGLGGVLSLAGSKNLTRRLCCSISGLFECSSLIVVGFLVLNLLPRFLEWLLILKLKF